MNNILSTPQKAVANIGEEIGFELGKSMVKEFQIQNPHEIHHYTIGKNILNQILSQPNCEGIRYYMAYNENGERTMVYVGINAEGESIFQYQMVGVNGTIETKEAIVADRIDRGGGTDRGGIDADTWTWEVE